MAPAQIICFQSFFIYVQHLLLYCQPVTCMCSNLLGMVDIIFSADAVFVTVAIEDVRPTAVLGLLLNPSTFCEMVT